MDIDNIIEMLNENNEQEIQNEGIELAKKVMNYNVFFQPLNIPNNKQFWHNCSVVICDKSDDELIQYLENMFNWLEDLTWPGALIIYERLKKFNDSEIFIYTLEKVKKIALSLENETWYNILSELNKN